MKSIQYDYSFMLSSTVGEFGTAQSDLNSILPTVLELRNNYFIQNPSPYGFMRLPYDSNSVTRVLDVANRIKERFQTLLVLGVGGSDLGARAVIDALPSSGMKLVFLGANTDPVEIQNCLKDIDWEHTAINVISKSGDTIETMSTFLYVRDLLIAQMGVEKASGHIIATTDTKKGTLRAIAHKEGYEILPVPEDVGGRFSVLSPVGLFPMACAGIQIEDLLSGARDICEQLLHSPTTQWQSAELFAVLHFIGYTKHSQNVHVLIPYMAALRQTGFWFRQLWAESLGKKETVDGLEVYTGPTPVAALGATDQHSQFQLYYYGPYDKIITFIDVEDYGSRLVVPHSFNDIEGVAYMGGLSFEKIVRTELQASALALAERKRPNGRIILPCNSAYYIGQLLQFLEISTVYMGHLLHINPFDQPGVELGKQNMYALFGRPGYEKRRAELSALMENYGKNVV